MATRFVLFNVYGTVGKKNKKVLIRPDKINVILEIDNVVTNKDTDVCIIYCDDQEFWVEHSYDDIVEAIENHNKATNKVK